jgi:predicted DNA-binding transcriptional regulator AlpA
MDENALPLPTTRCLSKEQAANYLGIGITLFDDLRIPPVRLGRRCVWDRFDLDAWLDDYKSRGRAGKEVEWPVKPESTGVVTLDAGGLRRRYRTAAAYASLLGLKTETKP